MNFEQWNAFLKQLEDMGYDTSDPKTTMLLRPAQVQYSSVQGNSPHSKAEAYYTGRRDRGSIRETAEDMQSGWAEANLRPLRDFTQDDLNYLAEYLMTGELMLFDPKNPDPEQARVVYWGDNKNISVSATCGEMSKVPEKNVTPETVKIFNRNAGYRELCYLSGKRFPELRRAALQEKKQEAEVADLLKQDQANFPELYRDEQSGVRRQKELRGQLLLERNMQAQLNKEYPDDKPQLHAVIGKEKALETEIRKILNTEDSLSTLLQKGQLRKVNGEKFTLTEGNEYADFRKLADYLASGRKVLTYKPMQAPTPIDPNRMADTCVGMVQQRENGLYARAGKATAADNDYTKMEPEDLEPVEVSDKLKNFSASLLNVLEEQVGLSALNFADGVRLKGFFPPKQDSDKPQEVNMLDEFDFADGKLSPQKTDVHPTDKRTAAAELRGFSTLDLPSLCLKITRGGNIQPEQIHQLYRIMAAAESGNLTVTGHGETVSQSRPITVDDSGKAVLGAYNDNRHIGCRLAGQSRTPQEQESYQQAQQELFTNVGAKEILNNSKLLLCQENIPEYASQLASRGIPLQEAVQQILEIRKAPGRNSVSLYEEAKRQYVDEMSEENPEIKPSRIKPKSPSRSERAKRRKLSEAAMTAMIQAEYETERRMMDIRDAVDERTGQKYLTREEYQEFKENRGLPRVLMQPYRSEDELKSNLELVQLATGHGVQKDSPEHKKMCAVAFNQAMERMVRLDAEGFYEQYIHMTDEQLVENWRNYRDAGLALMEITGTIRGEIVTNPYIDAELLNKCNILYNRYTPYYNRDCNRMDYIANIQYELFDVTPLENAPYEEARETLGKIGDLTDAGTEDKRMTTALYSVWQQKDTILDSVISTEMGKVTGVWSARNEYYLSSGEKLDDIEAAAKALRGGKTLFVCSENDAMNMQVISMGQDQKVTLTEGKDLSPELRNARNKFRDRLFKQQSEHMNIKAGVMTGGKELAASAQMVITSLMDSQDDPNQKSKAVRVGIGEIAQYYRNVKPKLTCKKFLALSGENIPVPSEADISARSVLSYTAVKTVLEVARTEAQANQVSQEARGLLPGNHRFVMAMMCRHDGPQDVTHNEEIIKGYFGKDATKEQKTAIIETLLREHLKNASLVDKEYTDRELVENWQTIRSKVRPMGMEYENFMGLIAKDNLKLDENLLKECRYASRRMGAFVSMAQIRMQQITNPYYRYGNPEILKNPEVMAKTMTMPDVHIRKLGLTEQLLKTTEATWALVQQGEKLFPGVGFTKVRPLEAEEPMSVNEEPEEILKLLQDGVPLEFTSTDGGQTKCWQMDKKGEMKLLEGTALAEARTARATRRRENIYEEQLMSETLTQNEKRMIDTAHTCQVNLQKLLQDKNATPTAEEIQKSPELKTAFAEWIVSATMVCNYVDKGLDEMTMAELSQPGRVKGHAEELLKSPLTGEFLKMLPKDPMQVAGMTNKQIFEKLASAQESLKQKSVQTNPSEVRKPVVNHSEPVKTGNVK